MTSVVGTTPVVRVGRGPYVAALLVALVTALVLLNPDVALGAQPSFLPAFFTLIVVMDVLTCLVLLDHYRTGGSPRALALSLAYLWSAVVVTVHSMVFAGIWSPTGLLGAVPSSAPWLWTAWHTGFPLLLGLALAPWPSRVEQRLADPHGRGRLVLLAWGGVVAVAAAVCVRCTALADSLPVIIVDGDYSVLTDTYGPWIAAVNVLALVAGVAGVVRRRRGAAGLELWAAVALLASVCDTILVLLATSRFTTGWYGARLMAVTAALVVLMSMLLAVARLHRQVTSYAHQLRAQNIALEQAQGLRDHMVAVVSHDLRTPLTGLAGYQDLLATGALGELPPDAAQVARRSSVLAQRLTLMVEDLLAVAGRGRSTLSITPRDLDLATELTAAAGVFPDLDVRVTCPPDLLVRADPLRLQQVLANLVTNARKYGAPPVTLTGRLDGTDAVVEVGDAGAGVPPDFVPRLFEPWTRADGTDTHGTGLGLSVVQELVERQGGTVHYEPEGNRFVVRLPSARMAPAGGAAAPPVGYPASAAASSATAST